MKKTFLLFLSVFLLTNADAQSIVQVAAYDTKVPISDIIGLEGVQVMRDQNNIYRYYISNAGEAQVQQARSAGYTYARIADMREFRNCCFMGAPAPVDRIKTLKSIFFDFDKSNLRSESKYQLDQLYLILTENPSYRAQLRAHTDAKGSNAYNEALSMRRANAAKSYLIGKGISASRLDTSTYGEGTPIAKNDLNGADTEEGRQLNRRVELLVMDSSGQILNGIVEEIRVPDYLRN